MNALPLKSILPLWLRGYNALVGKKRVFNFSLGDQPFTLCFSDSLSGYQSTFGFKVSCGNTYFWVGLENIEALSSLTQQFQGSSLKSLPAEIAPLVFESMITPILESIEKKLQKGFNLEQCLWGEMPPVAGAFPLYFEIKSKDAPTGMRGHFLLEEAALDVFLGLFNKYPGAAAIAIPYEKITFPFTVEVGNASLTLKEYVSVGLGDIILLGDGSLVNKQCARFQCGTLKFTGKLEGKTVKIIDKMEEKIAPSATGAMPRPTATPAAASAPAKPAPGATAVPKAPAALPAASTEGNVQAPVDKLPVLLSFEVGKKQFTFNELKALQVGYTFELETMLDSPVTICANTAAIGKGELVQINDRIGVRVTEFFNHAGV